ncbi:butyrophilin subfamily 1 member A1-like isoform X5 [Anas acuta]|uniref:butyrophilin subfamily 1 member A1-like isoform X5 n=1 Tax=Anas acuta TaxID=28680 RepID=UPI0035C93899
MVQRAAQVSVLTPPRVQAGSLLPVSLVLLNLGARCSVLILAIPIHFSSFLCFLTPGRAGIWVFASDNKFLSLTINSFFFCFSEKQAVDLAKEHAMLEKKAAELAWRKFLLPHNTVKLTLDPCTAHPMLVLSQDNRSVRWESKWQQVPKSPERFDTSCCVLGCEEFREGRHCWEVEVEGEKGKYSSLAVGVARASVKRKGEINMSPEEGIWAVQYNEGQLTSLTSPPTPLSLSPVPTRVLVCLDCTQGQVSFINPENRVKIFTFTDVFLKGETMRPWFWLGTNAQLCLRDNTLRPVADGGEY